MSPATFRNRMTHREPYTVSENIDLLQKRINSIREKVALLKSSELETCARERVLRSSIPNIYQPILCTCSGACK